MWLAYVANHSPQSSTEVTNAWSYTSTHHVFLALSLHFIKIMVKKGKDKVLPRTGHEGPEGGRGLALPFL